MFRQIALSVGLSTVALSFAFSQEYPTTGFVYNQTENSSLSYSCKLVSVERLSCDFVQTSVRKKWIQNDLKTQIQQARTDFPSLVKGLTSDCKVTTSLVGVLNGKLSVEKYISLHPELGADPNALKKAIENWERSEDDRNIMNSFAALCEKKDVDSYIKIIALAHAKDTKTCSVSSHQFTQSFVPVGSSSQGGGAWVVSGRPEGECGIVNLSRFEPDTPLSKPTGLKFWNYTARKSVTNPSGKTFLGGQCSADVDQAEYKYDWRNPGAKPMGCQYIELSPI